MQSQLWVMCRSLDGWQESLKRKGYLTSVCTSSHLCFKRLTPSEETVWSAESSLTGWSPLSTSAHTERATHTRTHTLMYNWVHCWNRHAKWSIILHLNHPRVTPPHTYFPCWRSSSSSCGVIPYNACKKLGLMTVGLSTGFRFISRNIQNEKLKRTFVVMLQYEHRVKGHNITSLSFTSISLSFILNC